MLMGLEDKPLMDEFVALYIGMTGNSSLEQKFRESLNVSTTISVRLTSCDREDKMRAHTT